VNGKRPKERGRELRIEKRWPSRKPSGNKNVRRGIIRGGMMMTRGER